MVKGCLMTIEGLLQMKKNGNKHSICSVVNIMTYNKSVTHDKFQVETKATV